MNRIMGVLTLKAPVYREIAEDQNATTTAAIIVAVIALVAGIVGAVALPATLSFLPPEVQAQVPNASPIKYALNVIIGALLAWFVGSWIFAFVSKTFLGGKTNTGEMLRVFGYTNLFSILLIIPCCGLFAATILSVIGAIIGIREAAEISTGKAILTGIAGLIGVWVVQWGVGQIINFLPF